MSFVYVLQVNTSTRLLRQFYLRYIRLRHCSSLPLVTWECLRTHVLLLICLHVATTEYIQTTMYCVSKTRKLSQAAISTSTDKFCYFWQTASSKMMCLFNILCPFTFTYIICF